MNTTDINAEPRDENKKQKEKEENNIQREKCKQNYATSTIVT